MSEPFCFFPQDKNCPKVTRIFFFSPVIRCTINEVDFYKRSDARVSKEVLNCKIYLNPTRYEVIVQHQVHQSKRRRLRFNINHVMGMDVSSSSIILDLCSLPLFEIKINPSNTGDKEIWACDGDANRLFSESKAKNYDSMSSRTRWRHGGVVNEFAKHSFFGR